jgi:Zn-dependent alcohol dehydrogenase
MKTRAAALRQAGTPWEITELELDPPKANEVLIQMEAAGLCHSDIPMILSLWHEGRITLSELITKKHTLDEINDGYQDLMDGKNIRGVVVHQH